jgi:hypothetical protein
MRCPAYRAGRTSQEIQEHLGHSTIRVTFDRYWHLFPSLAKRLTEGLDDTFTSAAVRHADSLRTAVPKAVLLDTQKGPQ